MKKKKKKKLESQILKFIKKSSSKINFKELGDKLNLNTKKDLKILRKKLRLLKERGKLEIKQNSYFSTNDSKINTKLGFLEIVRSGTGFVITPKMKKILK